MIIAEKEAAEQQLEASGVQCLKIVANTNEHINARRAAVCGVGEGDAANHQS